MNYRPPTLLVWFAFAGGAVAWALQFVAGLAFSFAQCDPPPGRWHVPVQQWQVGLAIGGLLLGIASTAAAVQIFRRTFRLGDMFGMERRGDVFCVRLKKQRMSESDLHQLGEELNQLVTEQGCRLLCLALGFDQIDCLFVFRQSPVGL